MKRRLYALQHYTESGDLKAPAVLLYILLFLSRTWMLLIVSLASHQTGNKLLHIFYPDKAHFYLGLALGILPLIVFLISGRRHAQDSWAIKCWPFCFYLIVISVIGDLAFQLFYLSLEHFRYSVTASLQLVFGVWSCIYILKSKQLRDCFKQTT
ncbi:DUF2919 domain-containing protein [Psychromonas sp. RZ22]|uniref:DUF2919 domain-containing protein n=1 Tax=Psychromonas algarum TaxID=2555643 RepID=UPI001068AA3D|nr:DUF2919 domain-containing protein [Psychromonas sp. RZ22]TEW55192.1 DUF2919 domain-containing protein [Psychromonas sp. RZ22]